MAFQNLRNNHQIYILRKEDTPILETGKVINLTVPVPKYGNMYNTNDLIMDITIDLDGRPTNFQKIPANSEIADFGKDIVIATSKEAMNSEILSMKQRSLDIINSIDQHKNIVQGCDQILEQLNPEIAEKQRQEKENKALREELNSLKEMFKEFIKLNSNDNNSRRES